MSSTQAPRSLPSLEQLIVILLLAVAGGGGVSYFTAGDSAALEARVIALEGRCAPAAPPAPTPAAPPASLPLVPLEPDADGG